MVADLAASVSPSVIKLFEQAAVRVTKALSGPAREVAISALASLQGYQSYLSETYDRVGKIKTFANPTVPVDLLDHFVTVELTSKTKSKSTITQDDLITRIRNADRIVVSATAGHGKSMLMRYIALALYENPMGVIPLFVELRDLNRMTSPNLLAYIHAAYKKQSRIGEQALRQGLDSGVFAILLDGFDELNHELRSEVEDQVLELARDYPKTAIIVSGRPDDKFLSWRRFEVLKVCPMTEERVVELIGKLEYDPGTKRRFITKVKTGLYDSHESFLSTPLLAILMLLTYEENANIPDRMHLFYAKAFETLFHKHDALKEQYERQRRSPLQIDEFAKVFSVFCLNTYVLEKLEFNETEMLRYLKASLEYCQLKTPASDLLFDLEEAVCLLQKEGSSYFFVHRSFQEYFTAEFLGNCPMEIRDSFIDEVSVRHWDSVLPMLFDMAADQIEPTWVWENVNKYLSDVQAAENVPLRAIQARWKAVVIGVSGKKRVYFRNFEGGSHARFLNTMRKFYSATFDKHIPGMGINITGLAEALYPAVADAVTTLPEEAVEGDRIVSVEINEDTFDLFADTDVGRFSRGELGAVKEIKRKIDRQQRSRNAFLNKLFTGD